MKTERMNKLVIISTILLILVEGIALGDVNVNQNANVNQSVNINQGTEQTGNIATTGTATETVTTTGTATETGNATVTATDIVADTGNATAVETGTTTTGTGNQNVIINQNVNVNQSVSITQITNEEKTNAINLAISLTVNIGIIKPTVVDVQRDREDKKNLRVRVKDNTGETIVIIVKPDGSVTPATPNVQSFTEVENNFKGKHVSLQFTKDNIIDFAIDGKPIFKSIRLGFSSTKVTILGSELRIFDDNNMVIIHDDTSGIITESSSGQIESTFEAASGISPSVTGNRVDFAEVHASILSSNPGSDEVIPSLSENIIHVKINHGRSTFIAKSINDQFEDRVVEGIAENKIGNIIHIQAENSRDVTTFGVDTTINDVAQNTVSINVNSATPEGRIMAMRINKDILKDLNIRILVDGDEIKPAANIDDLFQINKLAFLIVIGQEVEVLVSVPKFSEHQIVVTSVAPVTATGTTASTNVQTSVPTSVPTSVQTSVQTSVPTSVPTSVQTSVPTSAAQAPGFTFGLVLAVVVVSYLLTRNNKSK